MAPNKPTHAVKRTKRRVTNDTVTHGKIFVNGKFREYIKLNARIIVCINKYLQRGNINEITPKGQLIISDSIDKQQEYLIVPSQDAVMEFHRILSSRAQKHPTKNRYILNKSLHNKDIQTLLQLNKLNRSIEVKFVFKNNSIHVVLEQI